MKKILLLLVFTALNCAAFAQKKDTCFGGVYVTEDDFINNRLSYKIDLDVKGNKLEFPPVADWIFVIRLITPTHKYVFKAGEVYGYYECGRVFRYSGSEELYAPEDYYRIEEDRHLVIYTSEFVGGPEYYYSVDLTSPIHRLNMDNLKKDFKDHPEFIAELMSLKRKEIYGDLAKRDDSGRFLINEIYGETIRK